MKGLKTRVGQGQYFRRKTGQVAVYKFPIKAKVNDVDYPRKITGRAGTITSSLKRSAIQVSGTLMQTIYYQKYTQVFANSWPLSRSH